jgi:glycerate kinase
VSIAVVESAKAIGLAQLPRGKYHPFELDTEGLGALLLDATRAGMQRCLMGIGGSATNDGGFGLARALGWQFFNKHGQRILRWTELHQLSQVRPPEQRRLFRELIVAVDVQNPLLGPEGCTRVYGPQKGLCAEDFEFAERCLECMASVLSKELHLSCASEPGTGAAGGLGYGLRCFAGGTLQPGFDVFSRHAKLTDCVQAAELVLTGEGAIDSSTLMGKGVGQVASLCRQLGVPCIGLAGAVPQATEGMNLFRQTHALVPAFASLEEAMAQPRACLERLAAKVAGELRPGQLGPAAPGTP